MPISLGELSSIITTVKPPPGPDFSNLLAVGKQRQQQALEQQAMADARESALRTSQVQRLGQLGSMERAKMRDSLGRERLGFERDQATQKNEGTRRAILEKAYEALHDAQDRGDAQGVDYAKQVIERLGEKVEGGPGAPVQPVGPEAMAESPGAQPGPPPEGPPPQLGPIGAIGAPRPRAARSANVPGGPPPPVNPAQQLEPLYYSPEGEFQDQPPHLPPQGQLPPLLEAEGYWRQELPPPPQPGPPEPRYYSPEGEFQMAPGPTPQKPPAMPPVPIDKNYEAAQPPGAAPQMGAVASPAPQTAGMGGQQLGPMGGLRVMRGAEPVLELGDPGKAIQQMDDTFGPLVAAARTPEEKRRAGLALDTAKAVVVREGIEKAREAGMKVYAGEQANDRKTRIGTGKGVGGAPDFGGTGMSEAEYKVSKDNRDEYRDIMKDARMQFGINTEVMKADAALSAVEAALAANNGTGDMAAVTKAVKALGNTGAMSDRDFNNILESAGVVNKWTNVLSRASTGELPPALIENIRSMTGQLRGEIRRRRDAASKFAAEAVEDSPFIYGDKSKLSGPASRRVGQFAGETKPGNKGAAPPAASGGKFEKKWGF